MALIVVRSTAPPPGTVSGPHPTQAAAQQVATGGIVGEYYQYKAPGDTSLNQPGTAATTGPAQPPASSATPIAGFGPTQTGLVTQTVYDLCGNVQSTFTPNSTTPIPIGFFIGTRPFQGLGIPTFNVVQNPLTVLQLHTPFTNYPTLQSALAAAVSLQMAADPTAVPATCRPAPSPTLPPVTVPPPPTSSPPPPPTPPTPVEAPPASTCCITDDGLMRVARYVCQCLQSLFAQKPAGDLPVSNPLFDVISGRYSDDTSKIGSFFGDDVQAVQNAGTEDEAINQVRGMITWPS